jgi:hypothetical protein
MAAKQLILKGLTAILAGETAGLSVSKTVDFVWRLSDN